ncbi:MAG TPA: ATP-binding protein [Candidatus Acidoferrales bacterium]|nr:ATP-binding protein [Candidatus Acidoferrales bacterium]
MSRLQRAPWHGGVFAVALVTAALFISILIRSYLEPDTFLLFLVAVWLSAWYYGRAIGLVAMAASAVALTWFFLSGTTPLRAIPSRLCAFVVIASLIAWVTAAWRESRRLLVGTLASIGDAVVVTDQHGRITFLNPVAESLTGWTAAEARGQAAEDVLRLVDAGTRQTVDNPLTRALVDRTVVTAADIVLLSRSGTEVPIEHNAAQIRGRRREARGAILVFRDIGKRRQLEEQATHAQKMEAVGRLAGGVSGDFNNMLTVISGYAELLRADHPVGTPARKFVDEIIYAGERAAALTRQLLAFSRGLAAQPQLLDLNALIKNMDPMLRRLLGQNIELTLMPGPGLGRVKADPSQLEQVVVNLASNARDAMPGGGKLVIETANADLDEAGSTPLGIHPGAYVMLAVSDTGVGMDAETRSRLFEPFFTTKAPGKGSGLGLATVYGAIKQAEGQVTVYSQPNCGTIFEIYFPRATEKAGEEVRKGSAKGSETILVVDDEEGVRKLCGAVLQANGYDALEASTGNSALVAFEKNSHKIDLVLTDVVMAQMGGFELGRQLRERKPGLKILYMSGYPEHAINAAATAFLHKPFTPDGLLSKVREVLDGEAG